MRPLKLFWCSTTHGEQDYWVAATSNNMAIAYFSKEHGFELYEISAEEILPIPPEDRHLLDSVIPDTSDLPRSVDLNTLERWGVHYNENFHVFHYKGRIFRPEGIVRAHMRAGARLRQNALRAL